MLRGLGAASATFTLLERAPTVAPSVAWLNDQYDFPEIEGHECMKGAAKCGAVIIPVAEEQSQPCGFIRGVYDGGGALIHLCRSIRTISAQERRSYGQGQEDRKANP
jgi:hypothetical protein